MILSPEQCGECFSSIHLVRTYFQPCDVPRVGDLLEDVRGAPDGLAIVREVVCITEDTEVSPIRFKAVLVASVM